MNRPQIQFFTSGFFILLLGLTWMAWDHSKFPRELEISGLPAPIIQSPISEEPAVREDAEEHSPISPVSESTPHEPQLLEIEYNPERAFHPRLAQLVTAVEMGTPLEISWGNVSEKIAFRPQVLLAENFQLSVGPENEAHWGIGVYSGIPVQNHTPDLSGVHYTMAIVDGALSGTRTSIDGSMVVFRSVDSEGEVFEGLTLSSESQRFNCHHDPATGQCVIQSRSGSSLPYDWSGATRMSIEPVILEQGGYNPENGKLEKYVQPVPGGDQYEQSLKPMFMLAVLDKTATAGSTTAILQQRTSETLAMIANVASVYENQLGIRLYIQEIILTPSTSAYTDIPSSLEDFGQWCVDERPQNVFRWSSAVKWGAGLTGNTLGIAYVRSIQSPASVALVKTGTGWATLAHEMGHNLGSEHSQGGIMNAFDNGGGNRDFFTLVQPNETSARSIFNYAANRLPGTVLMRHPAEIPFALNDSATTSMGEPVYISVLDNDSPTVPNGGMNQLSIREVSRIHPPHAGKVEVAGHELLFSPSPDYVGTAFFSYSLQGSIGNSGRGWLHKGDVAVVVAQSSPLNTWTLAPGDSISFKGQRTGNVVINTQPSQALVHVSVDEPDLIVVRANPDATGSDTFRYQQGGGSFVVRLNYVDASSQTSNDIIVWNKSMGTVSLNPLTNDALAGYIGVSPLTVSTGIGTTGKESVGIASFNYSYSLVSARLLDSGKGRLATERLVVATDGRPRNVLTGTISFTPDDDARGLASIEYVAEDAAGKRMTNYVSFVLPLADLLSPGMMRTKPGNTLGLSVKTYPADLPPLHQETRIQWDVVDSPSNSQWTLENPESETARFTPESEGSYEIAVTVSDSGYETRLSVIVLVDVPDPALASTGGLLGHWALDELVGGSFPDSSAFSRSMFHRNVSTLIQGVQGKSAFFNGSDRYLRLSPHAAIFRTLPQGTISLWFRTGSDSPQTLFCASHLTSANQFFRVVLQDGRLAAFRQTPGQVNPDGIEGSRRVDDNQWHHLAIVSKALGELSLYLDGSIEASGTMAFLRGLHEINELTFAVTRLNNSSSDPFNGYLDEIRIFDEPSDLNQVRWLAGQSLTPLGIDVALSDEWVIAPGRISRDVFGFSPFSGADSPMSPIQLWNQVSGPEAVDPAGLLWHFSVPGSYEFELVTELDSHVSSRRLKVTVSPDASPLFAWAVPDLTPPSPRGGLVMRDLRRYWIDSSTFEPAEGLSSWNLHSFPQNLKDQIQFDDAGLSVAFPPGFLEPGVIGFSPNAAGPALYPVRLSPYPAPSGFPPVRLEVSENLEPGVPIAELSSMLGISERAIYSIREGDELNTFHLHSRSGTLTVADSTGLNFESNPFYSLKIEIVTAGWRRELLMYILLRDVDEPFEAYDQAFTIPSSQTPLTVGYLQVYDPENQPMDFAILAGDPFDFFEIKSPSGQLILQNPQAYEVVSTGLTTLTVSITPQGNIAGPIQTIRVSLFGDVKIIDGRLPRFVHVPESASDGLNWTRLSFDASDWIRGEGGVGYERDAGYDAWIGIDTENIMYDKNESVYIRIPFDLPNGAEVSQVTLRMYYEDGFVAYINGEQVASENAPSSLSWNSGASVSRPDSLAIQPKDFIIPTAGLLRNGTNLFAIHGLNNGLTSSDMLIYPELLVQRGPDSDSPVAAQAVIDRIQQEGHGRIEIRGHVDNSFGDLSHMKLLYGRWRGGAQVSSWENALDLGPLDQGPWLRSVSGLNPGHRYYFVVRSENGGSISLSSAMNILVAPSTDRVLISPNDQARYLIPTSDTHASSWMMPEFDDQSWKSGFSGFGFDTGDGFQDFINTDLQLEMRNINSSLWTRFAFELRDPLALERLRLSVQYDDGFVAYLNGVRVASARASEKVPQDWNAQSTGSNPDESAVIFENFDLSAHQSLLRQGQNILAVHGLNISSGSSDFLLRFRLSANAKPLPVVDSGSDSDGDLLPDSWESSFVGSLATGAFDDPDANGIINFDDYWLETPFPDSPSPGTDLEIPQIRILSSANDSGLTLQWGTPEDSQVAQKPWKLEFSPDLKSWSPWIESQPEVGLESHLMQVRIPSEDMDGLSLPDVLFFRLSR